MDIKNLLCTHSFDNNNELPEFPKLAAEPWTTKALSSPSSCTLSSPETPTLSSPPTSPVSLPSLAPAQPSRTQTRTPWTPKEDYLLQQGYMQGLSWAMISATYLPHRSRGCCWGRFKTLQAKAMEQREWNSEEDKLLAMAIKKHSSLFKHAWKAVAQEMRNRTWRECEFRSAKLASSIRKKQSHRTN